MANDLSERIRLLQLSMARSAESCFSEPEIEHLRCLIRLTLEFEHYLQHFDLHQRDPDDLEYLADSVFAGICSFCSVTRAYRVLVGSLRSTIQRETFSVPALREQFVTMFHEFTAEENLERKCRLLLDLFKIQIVFAGVSYE